MARQRLYMKFTTGHTESKFYGQENSGALALTSAGCQTQLYKRSSQRKGECTTRLSGQNETWYKHTETMSLQRAGQSHIY